MSSSFVSNLTDRLKRTLPGKNAQFKMAHHVRTKDWNLPTDVRKAAVLILLYQKQNIWHTALMKRTTKFGNDKHKGQVSFPGGQSEEKDDSYKFTALRETHEEFGIPPNSINILGALSELYIPVSNFLVFPYVGYTKNIPQFIPDKDEVETIIEAPINTFLNPENRKITELNLYEGFKLKNVPYFDVDGHIVWGATSMIISEFIEIINEI